VARVGDRWSFLLVDALLRGPVASVTCRRRYRVAPNVLSKRLKDLTAEGASW
jgi:DNA-binding HxlR family transcriptional regulator